MTDDRLAAEVAKWLQHRVDSGLKPDSISAMSELMMLVAQKFYAHGYGPRNQPQRSDPLDT